VTSERRGLQVIAHRGASGTSPENTVAAVRRAVAVGADAVECDVHRTRDGALVVVHDRHLRRTTDAMVRFPRRDPWRVRDFTMEEIRLLDAGSWFGPEYAGERVPTLAEWAVAVGDRTRLLVEVKHPGRYSGIAHDLLAELRCTPALHAAIATGRLTVQSFDHDWVASFRELAPENTVGLLYESRPTVAAIEHAARFAGQVNPSHRLVTRDLVRRVHDAGLQVHVWTPDSHRQLRRCRSLGVDGVITNHPERSGRPERLGRAEAGRPTLGA
jgi:glycerophosphoryl diester phosphodiesterase